MPTYFLCCILLCRDRSCDGPIPGPRSHSKCLKDKLVQNEFWIATDQRTLLATKRARTHTHTQQCNTVWYNSQHEQQHTANTHSHKLLTSSNTHHTETQCPISLSIHYNLDCFQVFGGRGGGYILHFTSSRGRTNNSWTSSGASRVLYSSVSSTNLQYHSECSLPSKSTIKRLHGFQLVRLLHQILLILCGKGETDPLWPTQLGRPVKDSVRPSVRPSVCPSIHLPTSKHFPSRKVHDVNQFHVAKLALKQNKTRCCLSLIVLEYWRLPVVYLQTSLLYYIYKHKRRPLAGKNNAVCEHFNDLDVHSLLQLSCQLQISHCTLSEMICPCIA
jgi:hypothetical protein